MSESYKAICTDFYVNQKLSLKLDLPRERQTILDLCDRVRRQFPAMTIFKRYRDELALESDPGGGAHRWLAIRNNNIRSGDVNPESLDAAYGLHRHVLETAPYFVGISPLDVDYLELLFGFDIGAARNHDEVVFDALVAGSPLARLTEIPGSAVIDCQPLVGLMIREAAAASGRRDGVEVNFEIKTRPAAREERAPEGSQPISVYLTLRRFGPVADVADLPEILAALAARGEELIDSRVVPHIIVPIREVAGAGG